MRLKSFHAANMAEAMRLVRTALGDDAIIVATREEEGGVRVTAAIDEGAPPVPPPAPAARAAAVQAPQPLRLPEIDVTDQVADALRRHGTPAAVAEHVLELAAQVDTDDAQQALGAALEHLFTFAPLPEARCPQPLMLVGPPGAGKTLTTAKLATRAALRGRKVGVVTTDTARAGGVDQLAAFTRLLKVQLVAVEDALALSDALTVFHGVEQVLVDSAGRNPFDADDMDELAELVHAGGVEPVLVLPGGGDPVESAEMAAAFAGLGARRLVVTRLDMTRRLGGLLAVALHAELGFSEVSITPKVAEGLTPLDPMSLARLLLPSARAAADLPAQQTGTFS
ncbi:flagellar biosynthesis protein FlhF [Arenibaculum pallidiluteum]|uniref:flagellar biosynthesis protein FlhF n=1 Tax=Arenibaculum pallidiluteum TaxID=2812559 RepID=UPI001A97B8C8|nr:GTPase [Arenibaculum pallidiluteum]